MDEAKRLIDLANERLRASRTGVTLELQGKGNWIYLRGTFPPRPGSTQAAPKQTRIALKMKATGKESVKVAELTAKEVGLDLNLGRFDWRKFSDYADSNIKLAGQWIEEFEDHWWKGRSRQDSSKINTWKKAYLGPLNKLPKDRELTINLLVDWVIENSEPDTRRRGHYVTCGKDLAKLAGLPLEPLRELAGVQTIKPINPRLLPTDEEIVRVRNSIKDPGWQYLYGLLSAYGLRGHEAFFLDYEDFPIVRVRYKTKTGDRPVPPLYPEWAEQWKLDEFIPPNPNQVEISESMSNAQLGAKITGFFNRSIGWSAYNLRHSYARRCLEFNLGTEVSAKLLGHSQLVHQIVYRAWVGEKVYLDKVDQAIRRGDRPTPPGCL